MAMDFLFTQQLVDILCGMEVHLVPNTQEDVLRLVDNLIRDMLPAQQVEQAALQSLHIFQPNCIYLLSSSVDVQYAIFRQEKTGQFLVLGPCRAGTHTESEAAAYLRRHGLRESRIQSLLDFCRQQPLVPCERLLPLAQLLAMQLTGSGEPFPYQQLDSLWRDSQRRQLLSGSDSEEVAHIRQVETRYAASAALTEAVKQGNLSLAYRFIQKMNAIPHDLIRSPNALRNSQNLCIILNTQLRHTLEEAGVSPYRLDQLSGGIARQIEKFKSTAAINAYFGQILGQYCALAQEDAQKDLSPWARVAVTYIRTHLSDNLTVKDAAKALLMNPDYLSARFHREVGMPFIAYVNQARVQQAAALLRRTDLQIQQIASDVGYNNTSYFAKQFVKYMGMTPSSYRRKAS